MGRPKGSKNKPKSEDLKLNGGEWLKRNTEKRDIAGLPPLSKIKIPTNQIGLEELKDYIREESITFMVELFPANRIENDDIGEQWKLCQNELIKLKRMIFKE